MNIPNKNQPKQEEQKPKVMNARPSYEVKGAQSPRIINDFAFGKAGNNAIQIMCAAGAFNNSVAWTDKVEQHYIELQHAIYLADERSKEEMKRK